VNLALSLVATSVPLAELPMGVSATSELIFRFAELPQGDQTEMPTSSCLVYAPVNGPGRVTAQLACRALTSAMVHKEVYERGLKIGRVEGWKGGTHYLILLSREIIVRLDSALDTGI
jgi:hypothetical protein